MGTRDIDRRKHQGGSVLKRPRVDTAIERAADVRLFYMCASAGSGKTMALRQHLQQRNIPYIWLSFARADGSDPIWHRLYQCVCGINLVLAQRLREYGVPRSETDCAHVTALCEPLFREPRALVMDDWQWCTDAQFKTFLQTLFACYPEAVRVILSTRELSAWDQQWLTEEAGACVISGDILAFTLTETRQYFGANGVQLGDFALAAVYCKTAGWATATRLQLAEYTRNLPSAQPREELSVSTKILCHLSAREQVLLMQLAPLDGFSIEEAVFVTDCEETREILNKLLQSAWFLQYDTAGDRCEMHELLRRALLQKLHEASFPENRVFERAGKWHEVRGEMLRAIVLYRIAHSWDAILQMMSVTGTSEYFDYAPEAFIETFEQMRMAQKRRYPFAYLTYLSCYMLIDNSGSAVRQILAMQQRYERTLDLPDMRQILGELALMQSFWCFNELDGMMKLHCRAVELFAGGVSRIFSREMVFTFGCPSMLFLYYAEAGQLDVVLRKFDVSSEYFVQASGGCGAGGRLLIRAEALCERGEFAACEESLRRAEAKAEQYQQDSIWLAAQFVKMRMQQAQGEWAAYESTRTTVIRRRAGWGSPLLLMQSDLTLAYTAAAEGGLTEIAPWLLEGAQAVGGLLPQASAWLPIVRGRILLAQGRYLELEAMAEQMRDARRGTARFAYTALAGLTYQAIAQARLQKAEQSLVSLRAALALAARDGIELFFVELGRELIPLLMRLRPADRHSRRILARCGQCLKASEARQRLRSPTRREMQVLRLLAQGYTRAMIAQALGISIDTVKKHLHNAYKRLDVSSRTQAVAWMREHGK